MLALMLAWNAGAFREPPKTEQIFPVKPRPVDGHDRTAFDKYAKRVLRMRAAAKDEDLLEELLPNNGRGKTLKPFIVETAVGDGKLVYARTTRSVTEAEVILGIGSLPVEIVSRDLASGAETKIFSSRSALIGSLMTRGGVTAFGAGRVSIMRRGLMIDSSVLRHRDEADGAKVVASESTRFNIGGFTYCGRSAINSNVDRSGSILLLTMVATCDKANEMTYDTQVVALDGSVKPFDSGEVGGLLAPSITDFSNGRVLGTSFESGAFGVQQAAPGDFTPLISGNIKTSALAEDGTSAAVITSFNDPFPFGNESGSADPFLVFPEGDPDRMVVASRSAGKIAQLRFCGPNLFAIKRMKTAKFDLDDFEDGLSFSWSNRIRAKYRVLQYRLDGSFVKTLGDTPSMALAASGCDGDSLALVAARSDDVSLLRYSP